MNGDVVRIGLGLLPPLAVLVGALTILQRSRSPLFQSVAAIIIGSYVALSIANVADTIPESISAGSVSLAAVLLGVRIVSIALLFVGVAGSMQAIVARRRTSLLRYLQRVD